MSNQCRLALVQDDRVAVLVLLPFLCCLFCRRLPGQDKAGFVLQRKLSHDKE